MIEVAAAVIFNEHGEILVARRGKGKSLEGLWEFPGGKLEQGETPEACLRRELQEEMGIEIRPFEQIGVHEHDYGTFQIRLIAYKANYVGGHIRLTDHEAYHWAKIGDLGEYAWAPADVPFVNKLMGSGGNR